VSAGKMCHNSIMGGHINFVLRGYHEDYLPTSEAQNGCHGNAGRLATWPLTLHVMASYVKNQKIYKLPNRQIYSPPHLGHVIQFWRKWVKNQGHTHI